MVETTANATAHAMTIHNRGRLFMSLTSTHSSSLLRKNDRTMNLGRWLGSRGAQGDTVTQVTAPLEVPRREVGGGCGVAGDAVVAHAQYEFAGDYLGGDALK